MKGLRIRNFSGPHFPALGLNAESDRVSFRTQPECRKIRTTNAQNMGTFHTVKLTKLFFYHIVIANIIINVVVATVI